MHAVEQLSFIFMDSLDLDIEKGAWINQDFIFCKDDRGKSFFIIMLDLLP